jgi:transcriptional regulator with XRE-family HTH domain
MSWMTRYAEESEYASAEELRCFMFRGRWRKSDIAERLGIRPGELSAWLSGKTPPRVTRRELEALETGVSLEFLTGAELARVIAEEGWTDREAADWLRIWSGSMGSWGGDDALPRITWSQIEDVKECMRAGYISPARFRHLYEMKYHWSPGFLAKQLGVSPETVKDWFANRRCPRMTEERARQIGSRRERRGSFGAQ